MFSLFQRKRPLAATAIVGNLWMATQTAAADTIINCFGKIAVFNHTHRPAGVKINSSVNRTSIPFPE